VRGRHAAALALAVALAAVGQALWPAGAARAAQAQPQEPLTTSLVELSQWVGPANPLRFRLSLANRGSAAVDHLRIEVSAGDPIRSRSAFQEALSNPGAVAAGRPVQTVPLPGVSVQPGSKYLVNSPAIPVPDLAGGDAVGAVVPLRLRARGLGQGNGVEATIPTFLVYLRQGPANPIRGALLVPLHERSHRDSSGSVYTDSALATQLGLNQPLGAMLTTLARPDARWTTLMVDPLLAEEISGMGASWTHRTSGGGTTTVEAGSIKSRAAQRGLALLDEAVSHNRAAVFPYADADLPALVGAGLDLAAIEAILSGRLRFSDRFKQDPDPSLAWPVEGAIDAATLRTLARTSADSVVLDASRFSPPADDTVTPSATVDLGPGAGSLAHALVPDPVLAAALVDQRVKADPVAWAQRVLAETALIWLERPGDSSARRGILLAPTQHTWRPPPPFFRSLVRGLSLAPWLLPEHATDLVRDAPQWPDKRPRGLLPSTPADAAQGLPESFLHGAALARSRLTSFTRVVGPDYKDIDTYDRNLLVAESSDWRGSDHRIRRAAFVQSVNNGIQSVYRQVVLTKAHFTLSAPQGPIGIRVLNRSDQPLTMALRLSSPKLVLPPGNQAVSAPFTVAPRSGKIQDMEVVTRTPGTYPVEVEVLTPDGAFTVARTEIVLTSTAFGRFGLLLTGGAAGFLLLWWSRRLGRRGGRPGRRRRAPGGDGGPDGGEPSGAGAGPGAGPGGGAPGEGGPAPGGLAPEPAAPGSVEPPGGEAAGALSSSTPGGEASEVARSRALAGLRSDEGAPGDRGATREASASSGGGHRSDSINPGHRSVSTEEPGLVRSTAVMAAGTLLSRVTGLLRVYVLVTTLGVAESRLNDTYNVANYTPNIIYELVLGGILSSIFVPLFVEVRRVRGKEDAWHVARSVMTVTIVVLGLISAVGALAAPWIIQLYVRGGNPAEQAQAQLVGGQLLAMFMPQIVFYGVGAVMTGLLNANRRFGVPMFAPVLNNLVVIAVGVTFHLIVGRNVPQLDQVTTGEKLLLGLGTTAGVVAMTMVQWPFLRRLGFRYRPVWDLRDPTIRKMAGLSAYTIGYVVTTQLGYWIVPVLAYRVPGGPTAYNTAFIFFQLPHGVFAVSVMTALLPAMSEHAIARDWAAFRASVSRGVRLTTVVLLPAAVGYFVLAGPIVQLLLVHGVVKQGSASQDLLTRTLMVFVIGLLPFSAFQLLQRAFYALQDTRSVFTINLVAVAANVAVGVALFAALPTPWKVPGLAAGRAANYVLGSVLLLGALRRRIGRLDGRRMLASVSRMAVASAVMGAIAAVVAAGVSGRLGSGVVADLLAVSCAILAGVVSYLLVARLLGIEELQMLLGILRRRRARATA
jgi:murein biosynthesis integral membrane protein MurJ